MTQPTFVKPPVCGALLWCQSWRAHGGKTREGRRVVRTGLNLGLAQRRKLFSLEPNSFSHLVYSSSPNMAGLVKMHRCLFGIGSRRGEETNGSAPIEWLGSRKSAALQHKWAGCSLRHTGEGDSLYRASLGSTCSKTVPVRLVHWGGGCLQSLMVLNSCNSIGTRTERVKNNPRGTVKCLEFSISILNRQ